MDSDYGRMERQQILLLAIRKQLGPSVILNAPALFGAAKGTAWTDLPREALPALVELFGKTADAKVKQMRIVPPRYPSWLTAAWVNQIRQDVADLLPGTPDPRKIKVPRPVATPRPTPKPTPKPTPRPSRGRPRRPRPRRHRPSRPPPSRPPPSRPPPPPAADTGPVTGRRPLVPPADGGVRRCVVAPPFGSIPPAAKASGGESVIIHATRP